MFCDVTDSEINGRGDQDLWSMKADMGSDTQKHATNLKGEN